MVSCLEKVSEYFSSSFAFCLFVIILCYVRNSRGNLYDVFELNRFIQNLLSVLNHLKNSEILPQILSSGFD